MTDYLKLAIEHLGVDKGSVINPRIQGDDYVLIVDEGIAGSKKYYIPLSQLDELEKAEPEIVTDDLLPVPAAVDLSYQELQEQAKESGIPANQKAADLRAALWPEEEW